MKIGTFCRLACAFATIGTLAACAPATSPQMLPLAPAAVRPALARRSTQAVSLTFRLPASGRPKSIAAVVYGGLRGKQLAQTTILTAPGKRGCSAISAGAFTCTGTLSLAPGAYYLAATAYATSRATGAGTLLLTNYALSVSASAVNAIALSVGGTPASIGVALASASAFATGNQSAGFQLGGTGKLAAQRFQIVVEDALGNAIVGPGTPQPLLTTAAASQLSVVPVGGTQGRLYTVTPLAQSAGPVIATASAGTLKAKMKIALQPVFYAIDCSNTTVTEYVSWTTSPIVTIGASSGIEANSAMAVDRAGNLYLANHLGAYSDVYTVMVFAPGATRAWRSIANVDLPQYLAVDAAGDIFVNENNQHVAEFTPTSATPSRVLSAASGITQPYGLAVDAHGNLYVADAGGHVSIFAPGSSTAPSATLTTGLNQPQWPALDSGGNLFVANSGGSNVTEYRTPVNASSPVAQTFGSSANVNQPGSLAIDGQGNVYVVNAGNQTVVEFAPNGSIVRTLAGLSLWGTNLVATDGAGRAYFPNDDYNTVVVFAPGIATSPGATYASPGGPMDVAVWP